MWLSISLELYCNGAKSFGRLMIRQTLEMQCHSIGDLTLLFLVEWITRKYHRSSLSDLQMHAK